MAALRRLFIPPGLPMSKALAIAGALLFTPIASGGASPATPREILTEAAMASEDKASVLAQIASAQAAADATLARAPDDAEALMARAMAISYRAKLTRSRSDALSAKTQFETLAAKNPRDPEAQAALGAWHLEAVSSLGGLVARAALGARKDTGLAATDRAVALGGDRALFRGIAALLRLSLDPRDPLGASLAESAANGTTPTSLDRIMQRRAAQMAEVVKGGNSRLIEALAKRLLPLGQFRN